VVSLCKYLVIITQFILLFFISVKLWLSFFDVFGDSNGAEYGDSVAAAVEPNIHLYEVGGNIGM